MRNSLISILLAAVLQSLCADERNKLGGMGADIFVENYTKMGESAQYQHTLQTNPATNFKSAQKLWSESAGGIGMHALNISWIGEKMSFKNRNGQINLLPTIILTGSMLSLGLMLLSAQIKLLTTGDVKNVSEILAGAGLKIVAFLFIVGNPAMLYGILQSVSGLFVSVFNSALQSEAMNKITDVSNAINHQQIELQYLRKQATRYATQKYYMIALKHDTLSTVVGTINENFIVPINQSGIAQIEEIELNNNLDKTANIAYKRLERAVYLMTVHPNISAWSNVESNPAIDNILYSACVELHQTDFARGTLQYWANESEKIFKDDAGNWLPADRTTHDRAEQYLFELQSAAIDYLQAHLFYPTWTKIGNHANAHMTMVHNDISPKKTRVERETENAIHASNSILPYITRLLISFALLALQVFFELNLYILMFLFPLWLMPSSADIFKKYFAVVCKVSLMPAVAFLLLVITEILITHTLVYFAQLFAVAANESTTVSVLDTVSGVGWIRELGVATAYLCSMAAGTFLSLYKTPAVTNGIFSGVSPIASYAGGLLASQAGAAVAGLSVMQRASNAAAPAARSGIAAGRTGLSQLAARTGADRLSHALAPGNSNGVPGAKAFENPNCNGIANHDRASQILGEDPKWIKQHATEVQSRLLSDYDALSQDSPSPYYKQKWSEEAEAISKQIYTQSENPRLKPSTAEQANIAHRAAEQFSKLKGTYKGGWSGTLNRESKNLGKYARKLQKTALKKTEIDDLET